MRGFGFTALLLGAACVHAPVAPAPAEHAPTEHAVVAKAEIDAPAYARDPQSPPVLVIPEGELRKPIAEQALQPGARRFRGLVFEPAEQAWLSRHRYLRGSLILSSAAGIGGGLGLLSLGAYFGGVSDEGWCPRFEVANCVETPTNLAIAGGALLIAGVAGTTVSAIFLLRHQRNRPRSLGFTPGGMRVRF